MGKKLIIKGADFSANAVGNDTYGVDSYVQDGLEIQLDGLNLSSGVWYDLKNKITLTNHGVVFGANGAVFDGTSWMDISDLPSSLSSYNYTIEFVYTRNSDFSGRQEILFSTSVLACMGFTKEGNMAVSSNNASIQGYTGIASHLRGIHYCSANRDMAIMDGVILSHTDNANFATGVKNTIGGRQKQTGTLDSPFTGTINAIRLYSRPLTEEEMRYNYNIDQFRFG